jgi:hypothetical protein
MDAELQRHMDIGELLTNERAQPATHSPRPGKTRHILVLSVPRREGDGPGGAPPQLDIHAA